MRTNTWLGLIALNQVSQQLQAGNIAREQKARDEERDEAFAKAHAAAQQGQFAMWVQSPDGQRFERWSEHALEASRAVDDRQAAWGLAWEQDLQERREAARAEAVAEAVAKAEAEASARKLSPQQVRNIQNCGCFFFIVSLLSGIAWLALVVTAPEPTAGESSLTTGSVIAFVLALAAGVIGCLGFMSAPSDETLVQIARKNAEKSFDANVLDESFPWHAKNDENFLEERQKGISSTVETASERFPRGDKLVHLRGIYNTRPAQADDENAPESIQRLLVAFREQDRERLATLKRDRFD